MALIEINVPGRRIYRLEHVLLDLNGTIALDGAIIEGVPERLELLRDLVDIIVITADTRGKAQKLGQRLPISIRTITPGDEQAQKLRLVHTLGHDTTFAIGNGSNDAFMLKESALGICVLGPEGASSEAIANCDAMVSDINAAFDLLLKPHRLIATLRR